MPQMSPIGWLSLFMLFTSIFMLFCIMNYYTFLPTSPKTSEATKSSINSFYWKW